MRTDQKLDVERDGARKAFGHGEVEAGGRRRAIRTRGMKQPQRGLGVAQLEKLRMQEQQSKSSCLKAGGITGNWPAAYLAFRNSPRPAPEYKQGHMMHRVTGDDVVWTTFMSSPAAHSRSVSLSRRDEHGHTVMSIMVPQLGRVDERDLSGTCNHGHHHPHIIPVPALGRNAHDRRPTPSSSGTTVDRLQPLPLAAGKELSSVQNIVSSSHHLRSSKSCGWKRPWQALHSRCLDLNEGSKFAALGAHQSGGFIRAAAPEDCTPHHPLKIRTRASEFLTLGLPSYNPISTAQHEARVQRQEASRSRVEVCSKAGGDADNLQLHLCNPQQAQVQSSPDLNDDARLSYKFSSGSLTEEHCHKRMELRKTEESLDLRLKLAI